MSLLRTLARAENHPAIDAGEVVLRHPVAADFEPWRRVRKASYEFLKPWEPTWPRDDLTRYAFRRRVRCYTREMRNGRAVAFFLFTRGSDCLVGGITVSNIRRGICQSGTIGYWMGQPYARKGYMTAALKALVPFCFDQLKLHRLEAACIPDNEASVGLLKKSGFQHEGYARGYLKINGVWRDHLLFARMAADPPG